jgi:hypothetical protein
VPAPILPPPAIRALTRGIAPLTLLVAAGCAASAAEQPAADSSAARAVAVAGRDTTAVRDGSVAVDTLRDSTARAAALRDSVARDSVAVDSAPRDTMRDDRPVRARPPVLRGRAVMDSAAIASLDRDSSRVTGWPVRGPQPLPGALLPGSRIIAYYGNPLSKRMGILGEIPPDEMVARLEKVAAEWQAADPSTKVLPALHLVATVAQGSAGRDGKWRMKMNDSLIARVDGWAKKKGWLYFIDVQVGLSTLREELPRMRWILEQPHVHLGIDPEFSMKDGTPPGKKIGTFNAADVNYAIDFLAQIVREKKLPPKVLIVHRFTRNMVTGTRDIRLDPGVQVVMQMDGWGRPALKISTFRAYIQPEPVQFSGFKLFYHNDTKGGQPLMRPGEVLRLWPRPAYIQYQ